MTLAAVYLPIWVVPGAAWAIGVLAFAVGDARKRRRRRAERRRVLAERRRAEGW